MAEGSEEILFMPGDLLEVREGEYYTPEELTYFFGLLIQNVCLDGENVLCEILVSRPGDLFHVRRIWQGFMRRC